MGALFPVVSTLHCFSCLRFSSESANIWFRCVRPTGHSVRPNALPYFLTFTQSWVYNLVHDHILFFRLGSALPLTWSISTEWFFYFCYPAVLFFVMWIKKPIHVIGLALVWTLVWGTFAYEMSLHAGQLEAWATRYFGVAATQITIQMSFLCDGCCTIRLTCDRRIHSGCIAAQLYLTLEDRKPTRWTERSR